MGQLSIGVKRFVESGPAIFVGSAGSDGRTSSVRGYGVTVSEDRATLRVLLNRRQAARVLEDIAGNPILAVSLAMPSTYRSYQIKGQVRAIDEALSPLDHEVNIAWREAFVADAEAIGMPASGLARLESTVDVALDLTIREVYDQTPGPDAGRAVSP